MRVLVIKTSSLGDIVHTFPALTDAAERLDGITFDWVVEESFAEIPAWHPAVENVIPSAMRRWRKSWIKTMLGGEWRSFIRQLRAREYDVVIDAQGLIKSGLITRKAIGTKHGLDNHSAREPLASRFYDTSHRVEKGQHAIQRTRQLFAQALGYEFTESEVRYGLRVTPDSAVNQPTILLLHGTTWPSKQWPSEFWSSLAGLALKAGYRIMVPALTDTEKQFANALAGNSGDISVVSGKSLSDMAALISAVQGVVSVDSGLAHLAAALDIPAVGLYGATNARLTGMLGQRQQSMQASIECSPCLKRICPKLDEQTPVAPCTQTLVADEVWHTLQAVL